MSQIPSFDIDPYSDEHLESPYALHEQFRRAGPIVYWERHDVFAMPRHKEILPTLKDWETFSSTGGSGIADIRKPDAWRPGSPIVEVDPPSHSKVRAVMQRVLSPVVLRKWRDDFAAEADKLVLELLEKQSFDGVADLAETYVATVFPRALGLAPSPEQRKNLFLLGELNFDGQGPRNARFLETERRASQIVDWYEEHMQRDRSLPGGFGDMLFQAADRGEIDHDTASLLVRSLLRGGLDTTASTISATIRYLAEHPDQYQQLCEDPGKARSALEESMRMETPIQTAARQTTRDVQFGEYTVPEDSKIIVLLASANRDPDFWTAPDQYDMNRSKQGHVALGSGIHMCVGQMVARMEGELLLQALVRHVAAIELDGEPVQRLNNNLRSLGSLPVRITPS